MFAQDNAGMVSETWFRDLMEYFSYHNLLIFFVGLAVGILLSVITKIKYPAKSYIKTINQKIETEVSWGGVLDNLANQKKSEILYKQLLIRIHPDNFIDKLEVKKIAEQFALELAENKYNYAKLLELEKRVVQELKIFEN